MVSVLGRTSMIIYGLTLGSIFYFSKQLSVKLRQRLSFVYNRCTQILQQVTAVGHGEFVCLSGLCNFVVSCRFVACQCSSHAHWAYKLIVPVASVINVIAASNASRQSNLPIEPGWKAWKSWCLESRFYVHTLAATYKSPGSADVLTHTVIVCHLSSEYSFQLFIRFLVICFHR